MGQPFALNKPAASRVVDEYAHHFLGAAGVINLIQIDQCIPSEHLDINKSENHLSQTSQQSKNNRKLIFIHIGKTGGTSLRSMLSNSLGPELCSAPFIASYMNEADARKYNNYYLIAGHISRADQIHFFSDRHVITTIREPIDRCLSFIHYLKSLPRESLDIIRQVHDLPLREWIEMPEAQQHVSNTMVRQLGGHLLDERVDLPLLLGKAKETLLTAFWVGRQETMDMDVARLGLLLGRDIQPLRENETLGRPPQVSEPPEVIDRLYSLNGYDLQLWRWAQDTLFRSRANAV
jgi:hypothetical protein